VSSAPDRLPLIERIVRNERAIVVAAIALLAGLGWLWTATGAGMSMDKGGMAGMSSPHPPPILLTIVMWWTMMAAMMLPSAAPAILLYGRVRRERGGQSSIAPSGAFLSGYLLAWLGASAVAAVLQIAAVRSGLLDGMTMRTSHSTLAGATLIAAGAYQLSPVKDACLVNCRSPAAFLSRYWRPGTAGALRLGLLHGGYCIGCCWLLMALLFVGGVMNFLWIAALAALVAAEKLVHGGKAVPRAAGVALIIWGLAEFVT
jgi:predicted metal-binding membrane protein